VNGLPEWLVLLVVLLVGIAALVVIVRGR